MKNFRNSLLVCVAVLSVFALALVIGVSFQNGSSSSPHSLAWGPLPPPEDDFVQVAWGPLPPPEDDFVSVAWGPLPPPEDDFAAA